MGLFTNDFREEYNAEASEKSPINTGVFIVRNHPWSVRFWKSVWEDFPNAINAKTCEQKAVEMFRAAKPEEFANNTVIIPHRHMNTWIREWDKGKSTNDFIVHYAS